MSVIKPIFVSIILSFVLSIILCSVLIPIFRKLKLGQFVREIGPKWHGKKTGTPTMGGLFFIISSTLSMLWLHSASNGLFNNEVLLMVICSVGFGTIGFIDDFIKVVFKRNLGLTVIQKFILQFVVAGIFLYCAMTMGIIDNQIYIPFSAYPVHLGGLFVPLVLFAVIGGVNSLNFTDGLDGLAATVTVVVMIFIASVSALVKNLHVEFFALNIIGALLGFLLYNSYPARVFMGDTGSLFLGGAVCSAFVILKIPLFLLIAGLVYVVETLSIILQVASFKLTGKRIFKMSPIHHHFEMIGWNERKIVCVFTLVTAILCFFAYKSINMFNIN